MPLPRDGHHAYARRREAREQLRRVVRRPAVIQAQPPAAAIAPSIGLPVVADGNRDAGPARHQAARRTIIGAAHAAIAQVDQVQVIDEAAKEAGPASRIRTHPVTLQGEELFIGMGMLQACRQEGCGENEGF